MNGLSSQVRHGRMNVRGRCDIEWDGPWDETCKGPRGDIWHDDWDDDQDGWGADSKDEEEKCPGGRNAGAECSGEAAGSGDNASVGESGNDDGTADAERQAEDDQSSQDSEHNRTLGARGEEAAAQYLTRCGYEVLERNWRCQAGEADIIAMDEETLVFIEVKTRSSETAGLPEDAVTPEKRRRYERIAIEYLRQSDLGTLPVRFDVIAITVLNPSRAFMRHHCNAFGRGE